MCCISLEMPAYIFVLLFSQTVGASGYFGIEIPSTYILNEKTLPFFSSWNVKN